MGNPPDETLRPILVCAAFSPEGGRIQHLGAANKIRTLIRILARSGRPIMLLNSAHNAERFSRSKSEIVKIGGVEVRCLVPFTLPLRPLGKLFNLLTAFAYARRVGEDQPVLVWVYNGYAFDSAIVLSAASSSDCDIALELEDWPTARGRGLNPKPFIDSLFLNRVLRRAKLVTCVNENLAEHVSRARGDCLLLPGVIPEALVGTASSRSAFASAPYTLGYFGGLTAEKGADVLLALADHLPESWKLVVCGSGALRDRFSKSAAANARVEFFENLPEERVYQLIRSCDAIVNPHRDIADLDDGVFPYKVFEALGSERLLISTRLPPCGVALNGVLWFDGSTAGLSSALRNAKEHFSANHDTIRSTAAEVLRRYSESAIYEALASRLPALAVMKSAMGPYKTS